MKNLKTKVKKEVKKDGCIDQKKFILDDNARFKFITRKPHHFICALKFLYCK